MNILMLLVALALSAIAAYYSIAGLAAIFAAAVIPIVVMGSILEISKLVLASWLYRNWSDLPKLMKSYFFTAVIVLMCLTSMGIFGYLSKAHLDQAVPTGDVAAKVAIIDEKIKTEKEIINEARATLSQLDKQVNETISRTANDNSTKGVDRSVQIRKQQSKERKQLYETISTASASVSRLNEEKAPLSSQIRKIEAEVGPIKYIAALIYGDQIDETILEKAVRIVILMIVSVFDPLAVLMLVGYNWSIRKKDDPEAQEFFDRGKEIAKALDEAGATDWVRDDKYMVPVTKPEPIDTKEELDQLDKFLEDAFDEPESDPNFDFLKGDDYIASPAPVPVEPTLGIKTIEQEVEELQTPKEMGRFRAALQKTIK